MTSPSRIRVLTPERLDGQAASLVSTNGSQLNLAVKSAAAAAASGGTVNVTGVSSASPNTLMQRDAVGRAQVIDPVAGADIATKQYVDNGLAGYLPTGQKGAPSGLATLDSSGFVVAGSIPQYLHQHRGAGTTLPAGATARVGDTYLHTGLGVNGTMLTWDGQYWRQHEVLDVPDLTARDALVNNYAAALHPGFRVRTGFGSANPTGAARSYVGASQVGLTYRWDGVKWWKAGGYPEWLFGLPWYGGATGAGANPGAGYVSMSSVTISASGNGSSGSSQRYANGSGCLLEIMFYGSVFAAANAAAMTILSIPPGVGDGNVPAMSAGRIHNNGDNYGGRPLSIFQKGWFVWDGATTFTCSFAMSNDAGSGAQWILNGSYWDMTAHGVD